MKLLLQSHIDRLLQNGELHKAFEEEGKVGLDFFPIVKLFTPDGQCTWLLTEIHPDDHDIAHGLCDLGMGCPEMGSVSLSELASVHGRLGLPIERDLNFMPKQTLSAYAADARKHGYIKT